MYAMSCSLSMPTWAVIQPQGFLASEKVSFPEISEIYPVMTSCATAFIVPNQSQEDISELGKELMFDLSGSKSKDALSSLCHINFTKKVASAKAFITPERLPQLPLQPHSIAYVCTIKLCCGLAWQMTWTLQIADGRRKAVSWFHSSRLALTWIS